MQLPDINMLNAQLFYPPEKLVGIFLQKNTRWRRNQRERSK